jgi:hypothetical protein
MLLCFSCSVLNTGLQRRNLGDNFDERLTASHSSFLTTADNRFIFACGFWDKSFRLYFAETGRWASNGNTWFSGPMIAI